MRSGFWREEKKLQTPARSGGIIILMAPTAEAWNARELIANGLIAATIVGTKAENKRRRVGGGPYSKVPVVVLLAVAEQQTLWSKPQHSTHSSR